MAPTMINVLVSTFPGLGLPPTLCLPVAPSSSISSMVATLREHLPSNCASRLILSTASGKHVDSASPLRVSTLLSSTLNQHNGLLSLRLSVPLCGGKGGFGSNLRAAGGRMAKKKGERENNLSSRNLDGRRLRTVNEAKALAEHLAVKPEMERKEKEERYKRWQQVVEACDRREEEIKSGKYGAKMDTKWIEQKEEAEAKVRESIAQGFKNGHFGTRPAATSRPAEPAAASAPRKIWGWDETDSEDDEDSEAEEEETGNTVAVESKTAIAA